MPSLTISLFSWTRRRFAVGSGCKRCLSCSSPISFLLNALNTESESCTTPIRASSLISPKVYDALFIGIGVVYLIASFIFVVSSSRAFCLAFSFCIKTSYSVSIVSSGRKRSCFSSATSVHCRLAGIGRIVMSFLIFSSILSSWLRSILDRMSASVFCVPAACMMLTLNCNT